MTKDHSTTRAFRIHQFLRLLLVFSMFVLLMIAVPASSGPIFTLELMTLISLATGVVAAEVADWIMWGIAEALGGKNGIFAPEEA